MAPRSADVSAADSRPAGPRAEGGAAARPGIHLFEVAGTRIRIDFSWFLIFALLTWSLAAGYLPAAGLERSPGFYWLAGAVAALLFFASILLHELAHAIVARRHGLATPSITLFVFGGVAEMQHEPKQPGAELQIALAGPLTSLAIAATFFGIRLLLRDDGPTPLAVICGYLAWVNVALAVFNMLPGYPLDGGRVLRALLWWKRGSLASATKTAADVGKGLAIAIMVLGGLQVFAGSLIGGLWLLFIGMFLRGMAAQGHQNLVLRQALDDAVVEQVMLRSPATVDPSLSLRQLVDEYVLRHGFRGYPVVHEGSVIGVISIEDLAEVPRERWDEVRVGERMQALGAHNTIAPDAPLGEALRRIGAGARRLLVLQDGALVGLLTKDALVRFVEIRRVLRAV